MAARHARTDSIAMSGSSWLPPFGSHVQHLLNEPVVPLAPLSFVPVDWVQTTFPNIEPVKGGKLEGYILQLRRTMKDLSKTREVQSDQTASHSFVLHSIEGMIEAYFGLNESAREMVKYSDAVIAEQKKDDQLMENRFARLAIEPKSQLPTTTSTTTQKIAPTQPVGTTGQGQQPTSNNPTIDIPEPTTPKSTVESIESPYTPKVYQPTPSPSPKKGDSLSADPPVPADPPVDPNSAEGKRLARVKRMSDLQQDHMALIGVKRHCVKTLRALRNVHVLVSAVDTLKDILNDKEFQAARIAFQAITDIFGTLVPYSKLPLLRSLNDHVECYKAYLRKEIFSAFREHVGSSFMGGVGGSSSPITSGSSSNLSKAAKLSTLQRLHHCCRLIDSLYSSFERKELVKWWITVQIANYNQLVSRKTFGDLLNPTMSNGQLTGFEQLDRQFSWILNELKVMYEGEWVQVFPRTWYVDALFVRRFFELVRSQIGQTLEMQEKRIKEENDTRHALAEAKKAQAIMAEMDGREARPKLTHSGSSNSLNRSVSGGANGPNQNGPNGTSAAAARRNGPPADPNNPNANANTPNQQVASSSTSPSVDPLTSLDATDDKPIPFDFYKPLLKTIEFENQIRTRWINPSTEASLTEEDLFVVLGTVPNPALNTDLPPVKNPPPYPFQFAGYISSAFHPYLGHMLKSERMRFHTFLEQLDEEDTWDVESAEITTCHFSAGTKLFVMFKGSIERYSKVMPSHVFLDLFKEYRTSISNYLELLSKHLPISKTLEEEEVSSICATINTSDYILDRSELLANTVVQMISGIDTTGNLDDLNEEQLSFINILRDQVDLSSVEEQVSHLNHRATHVLASAIVRKLEPALHNMKEGRSVSGVNSSSSSGGSGGGGHGGGSSNNGPSGSGSIGQNVNGGSTVSDENKYVREIILVLRQQLTEKAKMSSFAYLTQVVTTDFFRLYHMSLKSVKFKITENVAQQMLLDLQSLKNFLLHGIPEMKIRAQRGSILSTGGGGGPLVTNSDGSISAQASEPTLPAAFKPFVKLVQTQAAWSENLLKSLTSPNTRLIATFKIIFPKADHKMVYEVLNLRGLSSSEQEKLVKAYNATMKNPTEMIPIIKKDFFGNISQMVRDAKHVIQS